MGEVEVYICCGNFYEFPRHSKNFVFDMFRYFEQYKSNNLSFSLEIFTLTCFVVLISLIVTELSLEESKSMVIV